jgi:hypothetical protein
MSDLDTVKGLIARDDKENAGVQLASILIKNKADVEAWLLLGEIIDDPSKKRDCYHWVLKLFPDHVLALTKLQELESPPTGRQIASPNDVQPGMKGSFNKSRQNSNFQSQFAYPIVDNSKDDRELLSFFIVGIVAALVVLYVVVTGSFSAYANVFCAGQIFLVLSTAMIFSFGINKNRA